MGAIDKPVSACCKGIVFLIDQNKRHYPLDMEVTYIEPKYGCRVCGKECEVIEDDYKKPV